MLYNLLDSVDEAQMFVFEALLEKKQFNMSVPVNMSVQFYTGSIFQENYPSPFSSLNTQQPTFLREITLLPVDSVKARVELR
jgi:hypothetical protein